MTVPQIKLVRPSLDHKQSFLAGLSEMTNSSDIDSWIYMGGSQLDLPERDFESYVAALLERETNPPKGFVKDTVYWASCQSEVVGRIAIRHDLNDFLKKIGGHIGYIVRPSWRGKGLATEMLRQLLLTDRAISIGKLLLTCDETNLASERTLLKNGAVFTNFLEMGENKPRKKHFWITLSK